jgi:predicted amidohydrolase
MRICAAQTRPVKGDVQTNIANHKKLIDVAITDRAETVIFPELSITSYEPELAKELAIDPSDSMLDDFQRISDTKLITIGVGVPTKNNKAVSISMVLFQPGKARYVYSKKYLHSDEEPFFAIGQSSAGLIGDEANIALAICYELSVPEHAEAAVRSGAKFYLASVAKSAGGVEKAAQRLSEVAKKYSIPALMANCVGPSDNFESVGKSSVWDETGSLLGQLNNTNEGILIYDTETKEIVKRMV